MNQDSSSALRQSDCGPCKSISEIWVKSNNNKPDKSPSIIKEKQNMKDNNEGVRRCERDELREECAPGAGRGMFAGSYEYNEKNKNEAGKTMGKTIKKKKRIRKKVERNGGWDQATVRNAWK